MPAPAGSSERGRCPPPGVQQAWRFVHVALTCKYRAKLKNGAYTWRVLATSVALHRATKIGSAKLTVR